MPGRRTNLALIASLGIALGTGVLAYAIGSGWARWAVIGHGMIAFAVVLLSPWKSTIARRGLGKARPGRTASILLSGVVVLTLITGFAHSTGLAVSFGMVTAMQVHVGAALASIPLVLWHIAVRPTRPRPMDLSRRNLLRAGALLAGAGAAYSGLEGLLAVSSARGASRRPSTGSFEMGSLDPDRMPVTQWLNDSVPMIDPDAWRLSIRTTQDSQDLDVERLASFEDRVEAVLDCTGGWYARQRWEGVWLYRLLEEAPGRSIHAVSVTGYGRFFPRSDADRLLIATRVGGRPLSPGHGAPARIVAPGRRGFWWVKWLARIEVSDRPWWLQSPFPLT